MEYLYEIESEKDKQYSGKRDYQIGRPNGKGRNNHRDDENNWSDKEKSEQGLVFRNPL